MAAAAEETIEEIVDHLAGAHMCFITAGMGGGTGTGAAPIIAQAARELGVLTVGVVTKPFQFEGKRRLAIADAGVRELQSSVDTLIVIPNQNLFKVATDKTTFADAFKIADEVLHSGVRSITDLMVEPGLINLDFADVRTVMNEMGKAMMGTGEAEGEDRAKAAASAAIANPLLEDMSLSTAQGVLVNVTGGMDLTLHEVDEAANLIWSAKEAALKVQQVGLRVDTRTVEVEITGGQQVDGWSSMTVTGNDGPMPGWWRRAGVFLLTIAYAEQTEPPRPLSGGATLDDAAPRHSWVGQPRC